LQALVEPPDVVEITRTPFVSDSVRRLRLCRLASDSRSAYRPDAVKRSSGVHEPIRPVEAIPVLVEPHRVNVHLSAALVYQDEVPRGSACILSKPFALEHAAHTGDIALTDDDVEVVVRVGVLADQSVNAPTAIKPHLDRSGL
jgi:hypothetical protein